jgi:hypothetical protein
MRRNGWNAAVLTVVLLGAAPAAGADAVKEARTYFNAGAQAYEAGQFLAAIQAFERAYELAPREAIIFTIGQAYRRQFYIDRNPAHLKLAIKHYRDYLAKVPEGGRRADAAEALAELEPLAARLSMEDPAAAPPTEVARQTRVMVTSPTEGARVSLDGGAPAKLPLIAPVETGKHKIVVSAPGFFDETREVQAADGALLALDLVLREKPATLEVRVETDAEISVDGRLIGVSPLDRPIELPAGTHVVAVMKNGRQGHSVDVKLERGKRHRLDVALESTGQRVASTILFGTAGAALVTGGVFTALAFNQQTEAQDIRTKADERNIARSDLVAYNDTIDRRDAYRRGAFVSFGASVALAGTGLLLYSFDRPSLRGTTGLERVPDAQDKAPDPGAEPMMELSAAPLWAPDFAGASLLGRF